MERIGTVLILIEDKEQVELVNSIISKYSDIIIGRQGIRLFDASHGLISLVLKGSMDSIGGLTGKLGNISGINIKSVVLKSDK